MKENLLHFIWKLKLFSSKKIRTTKGEIIEIISVGTKNLNSGPDFLNAKIRINKQLWVGNVEIHINSADWYVHNHETDENYDSIILHVVWEHIVEIFRKTNHPIATLELKKYVLKNLLINHEKLLGTTKNWINCENSIHTIDSFVFKHWIDRLYFERLEDKSILIQQVLAKTNNNWEATLFVLLAKNFGLKVNGDSFMNFASSFDFSIVRKISPNPEQLEALFFGQAGLLSNNFESAYFKELKTSYEYLKIKFKLTSISNGQVQFFRLRPANFPTIRLSQLTLLYSTYQNLFSKVIETTEIDGFYDLLTSSTSSFWETHYTFETVTKRRVKKLTKSFIDLLLINTIIPLKFMHLKSFGKSDFSSVITIVNQIKPEKNVIIEKFKELKINSTNAFETQALLQLKNNYCDKKRCLNCFIGKELLKS